MDIKNKIRYYTIEEISIKLGTSNKSTLNKISKLGLRKYKTIGPKGNALYTQEQFNIISGNKVLPELLSNYNIEPVIIIYYIKESKINNYG